MTNLGTNKRPLHKFGVPLVITYSRAGILEDYRLNSIT